MDEHEQKTGARQLSLHEMEQKRRAQFRSLPGSRSDGGMAAHGERFLDKGQIDLSQLQNQPLLATEDAVRRIVENETHLRQMLEDARNATNYLEKEYNALKAQLETEKTARAGLETMIRQIAEIVVNGSKAAGT